MSGHPHDVAMAADGRVGARRLTVIVAALLLGVAVNAADDPQDDPRITVNETDGVYHVVAEFSVPQAPAFARATITDYVEIPRFMPEVRTSQVRDRSEGRVVVEQDAVARFLMFSKRVHLLLDVQEENGTIRFRDRCGKSFARYEGTWTIADTNGSTQITYALSAQPAFDVPDFLLTRILKRDARQMIGRLKTEIELRARPPVD